MPITCRFCSATPNYECTSCGPVCDNCIDHCVLFMHVWHDAEVED